MNLPGLTGKHLVRGRELALLARRKVYYGAAKGVTPYRLCHFWLHWGWQLPLPHLPRSRPSPMGKDTAGTEEQTVK